jgi:hypothetical protein
MTIAHPVFEFRLPCRSNGSTSVASAPIGSRPIDVDDRVIDTMHASEVVHRLSAGLEAIVVDDHDPPRESLGYSASNA